MALDLDPAHFEALVDFGAMEVIAGDLLDGVTLLRKAAASHPDSSVALACCLWALGLAGETEEARAKLAELLRMRADRYVPASMLAVAFAGLGEPAPAMDWLQVAFNERDGILDLLNTWWVFDTLRSDPRFTALLRRMNLPVRQRP